MRRNEIFWGFMLVVLGALFFLRTAGYVTGDVFTWFWPVLLIAAGAWMLMGGFQPGEAATPTQPLVVPLQGAREAILTINHGAGHLQLGAGAPGEGLLTVNAAPGLTHSSRVVGQRLEVTLEAGPSILPLIGPEGGAWSLKLNPSLPTQVHLRAGASRNDLDLTDLNVTQLDYEGGASSLKIALPRGVDRFTSHIRAGASSIDLHVPEGVAARFVVTGPALPSVNTLRFTRTGEGIYQSPGYDSAPRRAEVTIDGGATSVRID